MDGQTDRHGERLGGCAEDGRQTLCRGLRGPRIPLDESQEDQCSWWGSPSAPKSCRYFPCSASGFVKQRLFSWSWLKPKGLPGVMLGGLLSSPHTSQWAPAATRAQTPGALQGQPASETCSPCSPPHPPLCLIQQERPPKWPIHHPKLALIKAIHLCGPAAEMNCVITLVTSMDGPASKRQQGNHPLFSSAPWLAEPWRDPALQARTAGLLLHPRWGGFLAPPTNTAPMAALAQEQQWGLGRLTHGPLWHIL